MAQQRFDHLLQAIHHAALSAQELTEQQHIRQLDKYFDDEGKPIIQEIQVPTLDPEGDPDKMITLRVPLLSLTPPSAIKIDRLKISFKTALGKITVQEQGDENGRKYPTLDIDVGGSGGNFSKDQALADVEISFVAGDPSETFLRINDYLVKSVI